jgi:hypothetical protein
MAAAPTQFRGLPPAPAHNPALCIIPVEREGPDKAFDGTAVEIDVAIVEEAWQSIISIWACDFYLKCESRLAE